MQQAPEFETIVAYLEGDLPELERQAVEQWLKENPAALSELSETADLLDLLNAQHLQHFRTQMNSWEAAYTPQVAAVEPSQGNNTRSFKPFLKYAAAAAVLVAIVLGFLYTNNTALSSDEAFQASFNPAQDQLLASFRTRNGSADGLNNTSYEAYLALTSGKCKGLEEVLQSYTFKDAVEGLYIQGMTKLCVGKVDAARASFQQILDAKHPWYADGATWYLALCDLKDNNIKACKAQLRQISRNKNHHFHDQASKLLDSL